jgi:hypothetical protein
VSLRQAERRAGFEPLVPATLGAPDVVTVTAEPRGRSLVSLCWRERRGIVRLDEYPARLDIGFTKSVREQPEWLSLHGGPSDEGSSDGGSSGLGAVNDTAPVNTAALGALNTIFAGNSDFNRPDSVFSSNPRVIQLALRLDF